MIKNISVIFASLVLVSCAGIVDQTSDAYRSKYCTFDSVTFDVYQPGSNDHKLCLELWESGIDPDDDIHDGDSDGGDR